MAQREKYSREYKLEALAPIVSGEIGCERRARQLGLNPSMLRRWKQEALGDPQHCFSGSGKQKPPDEERRRLLRQVKELENEILKKARAAWGGQPK